jgi:hypothetical protein
LDRACLNDTQVEPFRWSKNREKPVGPRKTLGVD